MTTFECMLRSAVVLAPPKKIFNTANRMSHGIALSAVYSKGASGGPLSQKYARNPIGMLDPDVKGSTNAVTQTNRNQDVEVLIF